MSNPPYTPTELAKSLDDLGSLARNQVFAFLNATVATGVELEMPSHVKNSTAAAVLLLTLATAARSAEA